MSMSVSSFTPVVDNHLYTNLWVRTIADHRNYLLNRSDTEFVDVSPELQVATIGDIKGFLLSVGIHYKYHTAIITLNRLEDPVSFKGITGIFVPSDEAVTELGKKINTTYMP